MKDNFEQLFRSSGMGRPSIEGSFLSGTIVSKEEQILTVFTGLKSTTEFIDKELAACVKSKKIPDLTWQQLDLYAHRIETSHGDAVYDPYSYAQKLGFYNAWRRIYKLRYVRGVVLNPVKGGFSVGIGGIVCFLPYSRAQMPSRRKKAHVKYLINHYCLYKIIKINPARRNIVVSLIKTSDFRTRY